MGAGAVHIDGVAIVDALLAVMPAVAHFAVRGHRGAVHVTLPRGVCADRNHYRGGARAARLDNESTACKIYAKAMQCCAANCEPEAIDRALSDLRVTLMRRRPAAHEAPAG